MAKKVTKKKTATKKKIASKPVVKKSKGGSLIMTIALLGGLGYFLARGNVQEAKLQDYVSESQGSIIRNSNTSSDVIGGKDTGLNVTDTNTNTSTSALKTSSSRNTPKLKVFVTEGGQISGVESDIAKASIQPTAKDIIKNGGVESGTLNASFGSIGDYAKALSESVATKRPTKTGFIPPKPKYYSEGTPAQIPTPKPKGFLSGIFSLFGGG